MKSDRLLLDTHVWIWLSFGSTGRLKPGTRRLLDAASADRPLYVSIVSIWEIAMLSAKNRLNLFMPISAWAERALHHPGIKLIGLDRTSIVIDSCQLPGDIHADPADRFLIATAREMSLTLVTSDKKILAYGKAGNVQVLAA
jgi:PIN domain nuclease of toxin-antitoxin system